MKQEIKQTLMAIVGLLLCTTAFAHDFEVDSIFYNITDQINKTVEVTNNGEYVNRYGGCMTIPSSVVYGKCSYSVTSIGNSAFEGCEGLISITIPNSITEIGDDAFAWCSSLTSISIPNSVTKIGYGAFDCCTRLSSIIIPNSVTKIDDMAFDNTAWYESLADGVIYINNVLYKYKGTMPQKMSISIKEGTVSISPCAFSGCDSLIYVTIPPTVTSIGDLAFDNTAWYESLADGVIYINNVLYKYKGTMPQKMSISIKEGTVSISPFAFSGCSGLTKINIPNSVIEIGENVFSHCSGLKSITIPNSITEIAPHTFVWCSGLSEVSIPNYVTVIANNAFNYCSSLTSIIIPKSVVLIDYCAFNNCSLTSIKTHNIIPPICNDTPFWGSYDALLEVPAGAKDAYSIATEWCNFANIIEFVAVQVSTKENNVTFEIPTTEGTVTYTVNVYSDEAMTQLVSTANYDATGKIIPMATSFELSIDGLDDGTYYYDVVAKSEAGEILSNYTGTFEIVAAGIFQVEADNNATEVVRYDIHGRLLTEPTKGINIVKYSDGTTRKEIVK